MWMAFIEALTSSEHLKYGEDRNLQKKIETI